MTAFGFLAATRRRANAGPSGVRRQKGLPNWVQQIVTGGIIVLAVALDRWRQGSAA